MKQTLSLLMAGLMLTGSLPVPSAAASENVVSSGSCGESCTWVLDADGTLTISGTGAIMNRFSMYELGGLQKKIKTIRVEEGIEAIGEHSLACTSAEAVELPDTLQTIGDYAFYASRSLVEIEIPASVKTLERGAFFACEIQEKVTLYEGLEEISAEVFYETDRLTELTIPASVKRLGGDAYGRGTLDDCLLGGQREEFKTLYCYPATLAEQYAIEMDVHHAVLDEAVMGDANGDGIVDVFDLAYLKRYLAKRTALGESYQGNYNANILLCHTNADMDQNGKLNDADIQCLTTFLHRVNAKHELADVVMINRKIQGLDG